MGSAGGCTAEDTSGRTPGQDTGHRTSVRDEAGGDPGGGLLLLQPVQGGAGSRQGGVERNCQGSEKSLGRSEEVDSKPATNKESKVGRKLHPSFLEDAEV